MGLSEPRLLGTQPIGEMPRVEFPIACESPRPGATGNQPILI